jgi:hypothetical protein
MGRLFVKFVRQVIPMRELPRGLKLRENKDGFLEARRGDRIWIVDSWAPECLLNRSVRSYKDGLRQLNRSLCELYGARIVHSRMIHDLDGARVSTTQLQRST